MNTATFTTSTAPTKTSSTLGQAVEVAFGLIYIQSDPSDGVTEDTGHGWAKVNAASQTSTLHVAAQVTAATTALVYAPTLGTTRTGAIAIKSFKVTAASTASPFVPPDQPNPTRQPTRTPDAPQASTLALYSVIVAQAPIIPGPQPNPYRPRQWGVLDASRPLALISVTPAAPFLPGEAPNPFRRRHQNPPSGARNVTLLGTPIVARPFNARDFPNPRRKRQVQPEIPPVNIALHLAGGGAPLVWTPVTPSSPGWSLGATSTAPWTIQSPSSVIWTRQ